MQKNVVRQQGRIKLHLQAEEMGDGFLVRIYNENAHIGAVAISEWDGKSSIASVSVLTRTGHKDDVIARQAAYTISKSTHQPVCVVAGIHLEDITREEKGRVVEISDLLVEELLNQLKK